MLTAAKPGLPLMLLLLAACPPKRLEPGSLKDVQKLAVLVRVEGGPTVEAARVDSREGRAYPQLAPADADAKMAEVFRKQISSFELEERLREALMGKLPPNPPWSDAMPAVEVATALDALLVRDRTAPIDYDALARAGADAVLLLRISDFGLHRVEQKTGLFLKGEGRLFKISGSTVWRAAIDLDECAMPGLETLDVIALRDGGLKDAVIELIARVAAHTADDLTGKGKP